MQVLEDAVTKLQTMFQQSQLFDPCSTLEHQTWSINQSQYDLLYGGVSLLISLNLKLTPVPYATPKWPIHQDFAELGEYTLAHVDGEFLLVPFLFPIQEALGSCL